MQTSQVQELGSPEQGDVIRRVYALQQANRWRMARTTAEQRIERLRRIKRALWDRRPELHRALADDFGKNPGEADLTEVLPVMAEINDTIKHLARWMKPVPVGTPRLLLGTRSEIRYEAKGLVLILSPWNYPINLLFNPLVAALAAGNCAMIKPSSKVPHTAHFISRFFADLFPEEEVAVFEGSSAVASHLLEYRFDHIFFTGSPRIGKSVMAAAARHLTPVTLELGGKSPVIVDRSVDIQKAAERVMWGKFLNAGQTCVAPDYLLIHEQQLEPFLTRARAVIEKRYGASSDQRRDSASFCRIVSHDAHRGLQRVLDAAVGQGARIAFGGGSDPSQRYLEPTLLTHVTWDSPIMQEEIFGPILPILTFRDLHQAVAEIQAREKPLALYMFSDDELNIEYVLGNTTAGGSCVNSMVIHLANPNLPFGGVGTSGMGSYHGVFGFRNLSHERAVLRQGKLDVLRVFYPPYTRRVKLVIETAARFLT